MQIVQASCPSKFEDEAHVLFDSFMYKTITKVYINKAQNISLHFQYLKMHQRQRFRYLWKALVSSSADVLRTIRKWCVSTVVRSSCFKSCLTKTVHCPSNESYNCLSWLSIHSLCRCTHDCALWIWVCNIFMCSFSYCFGNILCLIWQSFFPFLFSVISDSVFLIYGLLLRNA